MEGLKISEVAAVLGVTIDQIHKLCREGRFPEPVCTTKVRGTIARLWAVADVERYAQELQPTVHCMGVKVPEPIYRWNQFIAAQQST